MITQKEITEQLVAHPLHTSLLITSSLLLVCSAYVKPPVVIALMLLGTVVYTALYLGSRLPGLLDCCKPTKTESQ